MCVACGYCIACLTLRVCGIGGISIHEICVRCAPERRTGRTRSRGARAARGVGAAAKAPPCDGRTKYRGIYIARVRNRPRDLREFYGLSCPLGMAGQQRHSVTRTQMYSVVLIVDVALAAVAHTCPCCVTRHEMPTARQAQPRFFALSFTIALNILPNLNVGAVEAASGGRTREWRCPSSDTPTPGRQGSTCLECASACWSAGYAPRAPRASSSRTSRSSPA